MQDQKQVYQKKQSIRQLMKEHRNSPDANQMDIVLQSKWSFRTNGGKRITPPMFFIPYWGCGGWPGGKRKEKYQGVLVSADFIPDFKDKDGFLPYVEDSTFLGLSPSRIGWYKADFREWKLLCKIPKTDGCPLGLKLGIDFNSKQCRKRTRPPGNLSENNCRCMKWVDCSRLYYNLCAEFPSKKKTKTQPLEFEANGRESSICCAQKRQIPGHIYILVKKTSKTE